MTTPRVSWPQWAANEYYVIKVKIEKVRLCVDLIIDRAIHGRHNLDLAEKLLPIIEAQASQVAHICYRVNAERSGKDRWPRWAIAVLEYGPVFDGNIKIYVCHAQAALKRQNIALLAAMMGEIVNENTTLAELFFAGPGPAVEVEDIDAEIEKIIAESGI